jgi:AraC-like DNA-binding protein
LLTWVDNKNRDSLFPQFNIHSTPLSLLVLQGLIFAVLLFVRYQKEKRSADLLIALLLVIVAYHRTAYTIGFMGWYDTFQNTKINYFLFSLELASGPLIYLYVRSVLKAPFVLSRRDWLHFVPVGVFFVYRLFLLIHDAGQESWAVGYEGDWQRDIHMAYVAPFVRGLEYSSLLLYLAFSIQLFVQYRRKIRQFFSNTYQLELRWIQLFLGVYCFLFVYDSVTDMLDAFVVELNYVHQWWVHFFYAIAIVYVGIKAYFTDLQGLHELTFEIKEPHEVEPSVPRQNYERQKQHLTKVMENQQLYLQPDHNLKELAQAAGMGANEVSEVINAGFGCNFNEFVNRYRVEEMKKRLLDSAYDHLSIMAIAFDSGFNSKATFNRIFKQYTGQSPSQFKKEQGA